MFRLLGVHSGPDISFPAAVSLAGIPPDHTRSALTELTKAHLLTEHTPARFTFHDLLRACATDQAHPRQRHRPSCGRPPRTGPLPLHRGSCRDGAEPDLATAATARATAGILTETIGDDRLALAWFTAERQVLQTSMALTAAGLDRHAWQLPWALGAFYFRYGYWQEWAASHRTALAAARRPTDHTGLAAAHHGFGVACLKTGSHDEAHTHLRQALELYMQTSNRVGQARAEFDLSGVNAIQGDLEEAITHIHRARVVSFGWPSGR